MGYVKQHKHSKSLTRKLLRRLLNLLGKILKEIRRIEREHSDSNLLTDKEKKLIEIITTAYRQQKNHFESNDPRESVPNRIVSIAKPYVRPIVRGKEVKKVGGDTSYANNENRNFCKENGIQTSFVKKGRPSQEKKEKGGTPGGADSGAGASESGLIRMPQAVMMGVLQLELLNEC